MKIELQEWSKQLLDYHIPRWEELPTFELYSDQVISLIKEYLVLFDEEETIITSSMINNYVKHKMMPKPEKKKYKKVHLAYLIAISYLKQVLTINQINEGITYQAKVSGLKDAYNIFCEEMEKAFNNAYLQINNRGKEIQMEQTLEHQALAFAASAFTSKKVADQIIKINKESEKDENE